MSAFHPDYGYPDSYRLRVCKTAILLGKRYAARKYCVSLASIYIWTKVFTFDQIMRDG